MPAPEKKLQKLNKEGFITSFDNGSFKITNSYLENKIFCILVGVDKTQEKNVIQKEVFIKDGEISSNKIKYPIFCLFFSKKPNQSEVNYINSIKDNLSKNLEVIRTFQDELYFDSLKEKANKIIQDIKTNYLSTINSDILALVAFKNQFDPPTINECIIFSEFFEEIEKNKKIFEEIKDYKKSLVEMQLNLEAIISRNNLTNTAIDTTNNILIKIKQGIGILNKYNKNKIPSEKVLAEIQTGFLKRQQEYKGIGLILEKNKKTLLEREKIIEDAKNNIELFQTRLVETKQTLSDDVRSSLEKDELLGKTLISYLDKLKEKNIVTISEDDFNIFREECFSFYEKINKKVAFYKATSEKTIQKRKEILRSIKKELDIKFQAITNLEETLPDQLKSLLQEKKENLGYAKLLEKINTELDYGCTDQNKIHEIEQEKEIFIRHLEQLKQTYESKNKEILETRKKEFETINKDFLKIKQELENLPKKLFLYSNQKFPTEKLSTQTSKLEKQIETLNKNGRLLLNRENLTTLHKNLAVLKELFQQEQENAYQISDENIKEKLSEIRKQICPQENNVLFNKIDSLLSKSHLEKKELDTVKINFHLLKLDKIIDKFEDHTKKLKGENTLNWKEKLLNILFKKITKKKFELENESITILKQIKNYVSPKNIGELRKNFEQLNRIFQNKTFTQHRSFLFFKFNPVASENLAREASEVLSTLKQDFTI